MSILDTTVVSVALPTFQRQFHASYATVAFHPRGYRQRNSFRSLLQRVATRAGALAPVADPCVLAEEMAPRTRR